MKRQKILVFDSGIGGKSVYQAIHALRPDADYLYLGDDAVFPYGSLEENVLITRVLEVIGKAVQDFTPDAIVIACHTASTLVLPPLRARFSCPIIGTVPAIKPAAQATKTGMISVIATAGTVKRDYTSKLIADFASGVEVTLVAAPRLAGLVEQEFRGEKVDDEAILDEIRPCFQEKNGKRTDHIVLACTHYPLILPRLRRLALWDVHFVDPAPAIAARVVSLLGTRDKLEVGDKQGYGTTAMIMTSTQK